MALSAIVAIATALALRIVIPVRGWVHRTRPDTYRIERIAPQAKSASDSEITNRISTARWSSLPWTDKFNDGTPGFLRLRRLHWPAAAVDGAMFADSAVFAVLLWSNSTLSPPLRNKS